MKIFCFFDKLFCEYLSESIPDYSSKKLDKFKSKTRNRNIIKTHQTKFDLFKVWTWLFPLKLKLIRNDLSRYDLLLEVSKEPLHFLNFSNLLS